MSQAIDIMTELEKVFDKEKAKALTNAILQRDEGSFQHLATKEDLQMLRADFFKEMSTMKDDLRKEMSQGFIDVYKAMNDLRKDMSQGFIDVHKSFTRMTIYFISAIGTIAVIFKVLDIVFSNP